MSLTDFLSRSRARPEFRAGVAEFLESGRRNDVIVFDYTSPPVKVERALTKLLETAPELEIERLEIRASSGCEYFRGTMIVHSATGRSTIQFDWDCKWKAEQQGWSDAFGFPDQIRAARTFGYDCFRSWTAASDESLQTVG